MENVFSQLLHKQTSAFIKSISYNVDNQLRKEQMTSICYARSYYYLLYLSFFQDPELLTFTLKELLHDIMLTPNVYLTNPDSATAQIFPKSLKKLHSMPEMFAKNLLNALLKNQRIEITGIKGYLPKNYLSYCTFPALYGFFTSKKLCDCVEAFLIQLLKSSSFSSKPIPKSPETREKNHSASSFTMPNLKLTTSSSSSSLTPKKSNPQLYDSPLSSQSLHLSSSSETQTIYRFILAFLFSAFSFTDVLWHNLSQKIGKKIYTNYDEVLNALKASIRETAPLFPMSIYRVLLKLVEINQKLAVDIFYDYLMITFQIYQTQNDEGLFFTCKKVVYDVLSVDASSSKESNPNYQKIYYNSTLNNKVNVTTENNSNVHRDFELLNSLLVPLSSIKKGISLCPNYLKSCGFSNISIYVSYLDFVFFTQYFYGNVTNINANENDQEYKHQEKLHRVINDFQTRMSDQHELKKFYPYCILYYPTFLTENQKKIEIEAPFCQKYVDYLNQADEFAQNEAMKKKLNEKFDRVESFIEKQRNLNLAYDLNTTLNRLRLNSFTYLMTNFLNKHCKSFKTVQEAFNTTIEFSTFSNDSSSLFLPLFQCCLNKYHFSHSLIPNHMRNLFSQFQENVNNHEWELINSFRGNRYLFELTSMLTNPTIGRLMGDSMKIFTFLFQQCSVINDNIQDLSISLPQMILFIVKVSQYRPFLDVFIFFSKLIFTDGRIEKKIDPEIVKLWNVFFQSIWLGIKASDVLIEDVTMFNPYNKK